MSDDAPVSERSERRDGARPGHDAPVSERRDGARSGRAAAAARGRGWWWAAAGLGVLAVGLHVAASLVFPRPWPDESHFLAPALQLATSGTLDVPQLNAPNGIFWMTSGYYVLLAPVLATGVDPLFGARTVSLLAVVAAGWAFAALAVRAGVPRSWALLAVGAWLVMPRVVAAGNIARMEAVILAVAGVALWLVGRGRWAGALAVAALAPLVHPVGFVVLGVVAVAGLGRDERPAWARWERVAVVVASVLWVAEIAYFAAHASLAAEHLGFQFARKTGRTVQLGLWATFLLPITVLGGVTATLRWRRATPRQLALWCCLALACSFVLAEVVGIEVWYGVLGRETAVLLLALVALAVLAGARPAWRSGRGGAGVAVLGVVAVGVGLVWTLGHGWFRMRVDLDGHDEWRRYQTAVVSELRTLDGAGTAPATVLVDPLSGVGQEVFVRRWQRLRFVQPTPATPLPAASVDYLMLTPGAPLVTRSLRSTWGEQPPLAQVRSPRGAFRFELYANPQTTGAHGAGQ